MTLATAVIPIDPRVREFLAKPKKLLIGGQWVEAASGKTFPTLNPANGGMLVQIAEGDKADIERAVKAARQAFERGLWTRMTPSERGRLLWKLADQIEAHTEESRSPSRGPEICRMLWTISATWPAGRPRSREPRSPCRSPPPTMFNIWRTHSASPSGW